MTLLCFIILSSIQNSPNSAQPLTSGTPGDDQDSIRTQWMSVIPSRSVFQSLDSGFADILKFCVYDFLDRAACLFIQFLKTMNEIIFAHRVDVRVEDFLPINI